MERLFALGVCLVWVLSNGAHAWAQAPAPAVSVSRVIGEVTAVNASGGQITLKTDKGDTVEVQLGDKTLYLRVPPGEKDLKKAVKMTQDYVKKLPAKRQNVVRFSKAAGSAQKKPA